MRIISYLLIIFYFLIPDFTFGQTGCTDSQATNFDSSAIINDGSCIYPLSNLTLNLKSVLDTPTLNECSGIAYNDGNLWVQVDNSDTLIHRIDSISNLIFQSKIINQTINTDWEDITSNGDFVFIGDFGNNYGNRTDLHILKFSKTNLLDTIAGISPQSINFSYSDQTNFISALNNNSFDCEAFFYFNDSLHLFTKDWIHKQTKHYILPADSGTYVAQLVDSFNVNGLITSASIQDDGLIALLGYDNAGIAPCFLWMLNDYLGSSFFSGNKRMFSLGSAANLGQLEGVCFKGSNYGYIVNERFHQSIFDVPAQIKSFDLSPYLYSVHTSVNPDLVSNSEINFFQIENSNKIGIEFLSNVYLNANLIITDINGKLIKTENVNNRITIIDIENYSTGIYSLAIISNYKNISSYKFIRN